MKKASKYAILLFIFSCSLFFNACYEKIAKKENGITVASENNDSDDYVNIIFDGGQSINLKSPTQSGGRSLPSRFHASLSGKGVVVMLQLIARDGPIKGKKYGDIRFGITVKNLNGEEYRSLYYKSKDTGKEGDAEITIATIEGDNVSGSFFGTLYSKTGKKTTVEGKFTTDEGEIYGMNSKLKRSTHESWAYNHLVPFRETFDPKY